MTPTTCPSSSPLPSLATRRTLVAPRLARPRLLPPGLLVACLTLLAACGGPEGPQGPQGPAGPAGASGVALTSNLSCNSTANGILYSYDLARFSSGSAFVSCSVSDSYVQASWSTFYAPAQQGASSGTCIVTLDIDPSNGHNFGWWSFAASGTSVRATYHDPGTLNDGKGLTLSCQ